MIRKDFILKELEKLNFLLVKLMGLKAEGKMPEASELIKKHFEQTSGVALSEIEALDDTEVVDFLKKNTDISTTQFKILAELAFQAGEFLIPQCTDKSISLYRKSLVMLEFITATEKTYDFQREEKIVLIRKKISDCLNQ